MDTRQWHAYLTLPLTLNLVQINLLLNSFTYQAKITIKMFPVDAV